MIIGQKKALHYLIQGLKLKKLSPSLIFTGPEGVGKRTTALALAKALVCSDKPKTAEKSQLNYCDQCGPCTKIERQNHPDLLFIDFVLQASLVKKSLQSQTKVKIECVRLISKFLSFIPLESTHRIIIIENAHKLTDDAANALLKILEEPVKSAQIILLAADEKNLPSTILSRCAILHFHPLGINDISQWLMKTQNLPEEKALSLAEASNGSFAKALSISQEEEENVDLSKYELEEFFKMLAGSAFRAEPRKKTEKVITRLIEQAQKKLHGGDFQQSQTIQTLLQARQQVDRYVSPRLVLENLYVSLYSK